MQKEDFKIDFVGIGFRKCGTTKLYDFLSQHPEICVSDFKETDFLSMPKLNKLSKNRALKQYAQFFKDCEKSQKKGEFSNSYVEQSLALQKVKSWFSQTKILVSIRNPVDRVISSFFHKNRFDSSILNKDIDENLKQQLENGEIESYYYYYLKPWFDSFSRENIFVVVFEEMLENPTKQLQELYSFLGVDDSFVPFSLQSKVNPAHTYRFTTVQKLVATGYQNVKKFPYFAKLLKKSNSVNKASNLINKINKKPYSKPKVSQETREYIRKKCSEDIEKTEKLIGKDLSIWKK